MLSKRNWWAFSYRNLITGDSTYEENLTKWLNKLGIDESTF
jgi:hypothetical protein